MILKNIENFEAKGILVILIDVGMLWRQRQEKVWAWLAVNNNSFWIPNKSVFRKYFGEVVEVREVQIAEPPLGSAAQPMGGEESRA